MAARETPQGEHGGNGGPPVDAVGNGLSAPRYTPITDVPVRFGAALLTALARARIAAYARALRPGEQDEATVRVFVDEAERADARTVARAALRALGAEAADTVDPLAAVDTEAEFRALTSDWHVDTVAAVRAAERDLDREDEHWRARLGPDGNDSVYLEDDHYIPPPPPPLPRLAKPTVMAMSILAVSILLLGLGGEFGLASTLTLVLGIGGVLVAAGMLVMRLRPDRDEDDDGAAI